MRVLHAHSASTKNIVNMKTVGDSLKFKLDSSAVLLAILNLVSLFSIIN